MEKDIALLTWEWLISRLDLRPAQEQSALYERLARCLLEFDDD